MRRFPLSHSGGAVARCRCCSRGVALVRCRADGRLLSRLHRRGVATPDCCSHAPPAAGDVCAAPLAPGHPREGGQALDRSAAADALPLKAALLHLDTDFELHRPSHGPGDAAVSRPTTRRVVVVRCERDLRRSGSCSRRKSAALESLANWVRRRLSRPSGPGGGAWRFPRVAWRH